MMIIALMSSPFWQPLDERISRWLHGHASPALDQLMIGLTRAGNPLALVVMTLAFAWLLRWRYERKRVAAVYAMAALTSYLLNAWLKTLFGRARPQLWEQVIALPHDASFPSGHAMISMTVYGLGAWLLAEHFAAWRKTILFVMGLLILLIGLSRVYLGVHWPSDVLAGFSVGFLIVVLSALWHRRLLPAQVNVTQDEQSG